MGYQKREMWFFQHRNNIGQWETTGPLPPCEYSTIQQQDTMTRHNIRLHGIQINSPSQQCRKMVLECLLTYDVLMHGIMIPSEEGYWNISSNIPNKEILSTAMKNANDRRSSKVWCFGQSKKMQQQNTMTLKYNEMEFKLTLTVQDNNVGRSKAHIFHHFQIHIDTLRTQGTEICISISANGQ